MIMDNKTKQKKEKLSYDKDGGFIFMKNWSPILRWICILPAALITFIAVRFSLLDPFLKMIENTSYLLSFYVRVVTSGLVYLAIVDVVSGTAPKNRVLVSIITAIILGLVVIFLTSVSYDVISDYEVFQYGFKFSPISKTHLITGLVISFFSNMLGLFLGVNNTKERQKKSS